jgi:hypothetical protein
MPKAHKVQKALICVSEGKGGVGKSTTSKAIAASQKREQPEARVLIIDTDYANPMVLNPASGMEVLTCDPKDPEQRFRITAAMSKYDIVVVDGRGGDAELYEALFRESIAERASETGHVLVWVRPVTTSHYTTLGLVEQAEAMKGLGVRYVIARMEHSGRTRVHYEGWLSSEDRAAALRHGAHEIVVADLGVRLVDDLAEFSLSVLDLANRDFSGLPEALRPAAESVFDEARQLGAKAWLSGFQRSFRSILDPAAPKAA